MRAVGEADRRRAAAHLLHGDDVLEIAEPRPAVLLLHGDAEQPHVAELGPELARELVAPVDLGSERGDLVGRETAHAGAQLVGRLAEVEVERREIVGDHGGLLSTDAAPWLAPAATLGKDRFGRCVAVEAFTQPA